MDWLAIAMLIGERSARGLALLDRLGNIRMFNGAMELALGWRRHEVEGRAWVDVCTPPELAAATSWWLKQGLVGALRAYETEALRRDGRRVVLLLDMSRVGHGRDQGLLLSVQSVRPVGLTIDTLAGRDIDYEISSSVSDFGVLTKLSCVGAELPIPSDAAEARCFELLHRQGAPCLDCPALRVHAEPWPRTTIRRRGERTQCFDVITAEPSGPALMKVSIRVITDQTLSTLQESKVSALADKANLTEREREVLGCLLKGDSLDGISTTLGLSLRTVKFHQANILQKLGADSRSDLLRLFGF